MSNKITNEHPRKTDKALFNISNQRLLEKTLKMLCIPGVL